MSELNPNYIEVVSTLKYIRLLKGYTLDDVEQISNGDFTKEAVGSYERNDRNISFKRLLQLCELYKVSIYTIIRHSMYGEPIHVMRVKEKEHAIRTTA